MKKRLLYIIVFLTLNSGTVFSQNPGDSLFKSSHIHDINIVFSQPNFWDSLMYYKQHSDSFNLSTQAMMGKFVIDGTLIDSVGVTLKGNSSFGYPGQKKPIKISFNHYVAGKKLEGLSALILNNNALDPTMMREKLLLDFMNKKSLPAPRCTYARVFYNGQYVGLYKMLEQTDKQFISTHFANWGGNLFKGDPNGSLNWINNTPASYYPYYELHSNTIANNWSDLVNLIDNINNTPAPTFYDTLETNLNTTPFIQQWAARNLFVDLDAYFHAPHNYYLYHNTVTNKFEWSTWDVSVAFGFYPFLLEDSTEHTSILSSSFPLTTRMLADSNYKKIYLNTICDYLNYLDTSVMSPIIDSIATKIYPSFAAEPDSNQMFPEQALFWTCDTLTVHTPVGDIPGLKKFITKRRNIVLAELSSIGWACPLTSIYAIDKEELQIKIYPNPFSFETNLQTTRYFTNATLTLYNSFGQQVRLQKNIFGKTVVLNRENLPAGIYFLRLMEDNRVILTSRLVIAE